jgi:competence protein ComEA
MSRSKAVVAGLGLLGVASLLSWAWWPSQAPALDCPPIGVNLDDGGIAHCAPGLPLPAGQAATVGQKVPFERLSAADLAMLPGIGKELADALITARNARGRFCSWDEVDEVAGVGPARLERLRQLADIPRCDAGV